MIYLPIITILASAIISRKVTCSWLSPGSFFSLCWSFFLFVPLVFASNYNIDIIGLWFIAIFSMACSAGSIIAFKPLLNYSNYSNIKSKISNGSELINPLLILCTISFFGLYLLFKHALSTYSFGYYSFTWLSIPNLIAVDRYNGELNYPFIIKYSLYCIYPANLLGGLLISLEKNSFRIKIISIIPLFAAFFLGILEGARSGILLGIIIFFSGWLSTYIFYNSQYKSGRSYLKLGIGIVSFIASFTLIFILIQWLRQGMDNLIVDLLMDRIKAYFFGYLAAFSQWLVLFENINLSGGLTTLAGPFNFVGVIDRPLGFYDPINIYSGITTNIFTAFRGLVLDFSIPGAIIFAFIFGFITQLFFQKGEYGNLITTIPISIFYAFTLYSPLISIFHYNSIIFSWVFLFFLTLFRQNEYQNHHS